MKTSPDGQNYQEENKIIDLQSYQEKKISAQKEKRLQILYQFIEQAGQFYDQLNEYKKTAQLCAANKYYKNYSDNEEMYNCLIQKIGHIKQEEKDIPIRQIINTIDCMREHTYHPLTYLHIKELLCHLKIEFNENKYHQSYLQTIKYLQSKCPEQSFYSGQDTLHNY